MAFESVGVPQELLKEILAAGFVSPTPIQAQTWPITLKNRDIVAISKIGFGKTLGYLIPAFVLVKRVYPNINGPTVVILAPTRELATQIHGVANNFGGSAKISCTELERGANIVVADILEMRNINFQHVRMIVLDEVDRMLDMGFGPQIRKILKERPSGTQCLVYTANWTEEVRKIGNDLLVSPVQFNITKTDEIAAANESIIQYVEVIHQMQKQSRVEEILRSEGRGSKIIIFCSNKNSFYQLTDRIGRNFGAAAIHENKSRDSVLNQFRSGKSPILIATEFFERGLDIRDVRVVINYDFPYDVEAYVDRIGQIGWADAKGVAYTFFSDQDNKHADDLIKVLERANQHVPTEVREIARHGFGRNRGGMRCFGRWDSDGCPNTRDTGFGVNDGLVGGDTRDCRFGGRGDVRDSGFGVVRDRHGFGGRSGGRDDNFGCRGGPRGVGLGGPYISFDRNERVMGSRGRGRGRGRFDRGRSPSRSRSRGRSYSRSRSPRR